MVDNEPILINRLFYYPTRKQREKGVHPMPKKHFIVTFSHIIGVKDNTFTLLSTHFLEAIRVLEFDESFNSPIQNYVWPPHLEKLSFRNTSFNQPLTDVTLPNSLRILDLGDWFNESIDRFELPNQLEELHLGVRFTRSIARIKLTDSLRIFYLGRWYYYSRDQLLSWPTNLHKLTIGSLSLLSSNRKKIRFPDSIRVLCFLSEMKSVENIIWPPFLEELYFIREFDGHIDQTQLPPSLRVLKFGFSVFQNRLIKPPSQTGACE